MERTETPALVTVANVDSYDYPTSARAIKACTLVFQNVPRPVRKKNIEYIDNYPVTSPGTPVIWAPYHYQQVFRPVPDLVYTIIRRFWIKPVVDFTSTTTINATTLLVPDDWLEVVDYTAAIRGFDELQNQQKGQETRVILFGDPKHPEQPGLIKQRLQQIESENMNSDYGMRMKLRPYTSTI
jgi:hypothetical protein